MSPALPCREHVMSSLGNSSTSNLLFLLSVVALFFSCDGWLVSFGGPSFIDLRAHRQQRNCYRWGLLQQSPRCRARHRVQQQHDVHVWSALYGEGPGAQGQGREGDVEITSGESSFEDWKEYFLRNNLGDPMTAPSSWEEENSSSRSGTGSSSMNSSKKISTPRLKAKVKNYCSLLKPEYSTV